ncbi:ATP-binding protein [Acidobacteriota bacterium]
MKKRAFIAYLCIGAVVFLISIYGHFRLHQRPGLPPDLTKSNIRQLDQTKIVTEKDIEFVLSTRAIGDRVHVIHEVDGNTRAKDVILIPFYSRTSNHIIFLVIGLVGLVIGALVFILRPDESRTRVFYLAFLAFSATVIISHGFFGIRKEWFSYIPGILFYLLYALIPALLLHFILFFYRPVMKRKIALIYIPALFFSALLIGQFLYSALNASITHFRYFQRAYYAFRYYIFIYIIISAVYLVLGYRRSSNAEEKAQIKWIYYFLLIGLGPFFILYQLPLLLRLTPFLSEELSSVFFIFIPIGFAFSIIRFRLMDIELIINRSLVYSFLTIFTVSVYLFSVRFFHELVSRIVAIEEAVVAALAALAAAAVFHPARRRIQRFVDKSFFRVAYDYREAIRSFNEEAHKIVDTSQIADLFLKKINTALPLEGMGIIVYAAKGGARVPLVKRDGENSLDLLSPLLSGPNIVLARKRAVQIEAGLNFSQEKKLEERNVEIAFSLPFRSTSLSGSVTLGKKKSGAKFTHDDIELLMGLAEGLALNIERTRLQEEVILEQAEKHKLDDLNRMKTEFISTVSHELRTPMSSIHGLSEMLQSGKIKDRSKEEQILGVMAEECSRLSRFLHNILDIGKIEQDAKTYSFVRVDIQSVIEEIIDLFRSQLESGGFVIHKDVPQDPLSLDVDRDAVKQALTNLVDNAIKYSSDKREITIRLIENKNAVVIQIQDNGIGISLKDQKKIFANFFRAKEAIQHSPKGVGLGLKVVKHIMDAHKGEITCDSQLDKGSTFNLIFKKP